MLIAVATSVSNFLTAISVILFVSSAAKKNGIYEAAEKPDIFNPFAVCEALGQLYAMLRFTD